MINNFITNLNKSITLRKRLRKLVSASTELKYLVGFFYFSGWREIYQALPKNNDLILKILVGLQVDKHLSGIIEIDDHTDKLSNEEYFSQFMKSPGYAINNPEMDNEYVYDQKFFP